MPKSTENVSSADNQQETQTNLYSQVSKGILRDYTLDTLKFSRSLAILLALLYTDGCVSPHGVRSWRLYFSNKSLVAINLFINCLIDVFEIPASRVRIKKREHDVYAAILTSKEVGQYLTNRFGTFRTLKFEDGHYPDTHLPVHKLIESNFVGIFLQVAFSMDGCVKFYPVIAKNGRRWLERCLTLSCHHANLREDYCCLLSSLGIGFVNIHKDQVIKIRKKDNLLKYAKEVRFIDGLVATKSSKFWCGIDKNKILDEMIKSYSNVSSYLSPYIPEEKNNKE